MGKVRKTNMSNSSQPLRPPITPEADENLMISLAMDLVKQRLIDGTASSQETTHFLKLATQKYKMEKDNLRKQGELMDAKIEQIHSSVRNDELFKEAISAFKVYSGNAGAALDGDDPYED